MPSNVNSFNIILNRARAFGGFEELTSVADFDVWTGISETYSHIIISSPHHEDVKICVDWSPALAYASKKKKLYSQPREYVIKTLTENPNFFERTIVCPATVQFKQTEDMAPWQGDTYLHHMMYEIFLVANLSSPGCFNLYRSYIKVPSLDPEKDPFAQTELQLSEYLFEMAWHDAQETPWLKIGFLPFHEVSSWYQHLKLRFRQVAKSNIEKVLFALLHLGRRTYLEPEATLWIASALEAIYDPPHGSSFQFLNKRISTLFGLNEKQQGIMKRGLREFYNVRNSFAHGGGVICHPIADESLDSEINEITSDVLSVNDFASAILLGTIQELIRKKVVEIKFDEVISASVGRISRKA